VVLIAGGTGRLGTLLTARLAARGADVRILTRKSERATHVMGEHVEVVEGDVRDPESLKAALVGAEHVVSAIQGFAGPGGVSPRSVDRDGNMNLIDAAARAGAHVVLMSVVGASPDHPMELFRMKHAAEQHLRATTPTATIVRATAFMELWIDLLRQTAARSGRPLIFGHGANPINFVSVRDVAELIDDILDDPAASGSTIAAIGPQNLTFKQFATRLQGSADGPAGAPRHVPRAMLRLISVLAAPVKPEQARQARAALAMDTIDLTDHATGEHVAVRDLPTSLDDVLRRSASPSAVKDATP
jgi:uncharacterized protein YbjT (DUF2867 family)